MQQQRSISWPAPCQGLRGVSPADLPREIFAGITLAAMILPLNIGYAQVAGLPPSVGLYAAIIPLVIYAVFTSSRHLVSGPDASVGALLGAALLGFAAPDDALRLDYALALALMCGLLFLVFWMFRLAFLANFLSRAVLAGFVTGLAIEVLTNQIRKILGAPHGEGSGLEAANRLHEAMATSIDSTGYFLELLVLAESVPDANFYSVAIGVAAFAIVRALKRHAPKIPGALVTLVILTAVVALFGLDQKGVSVLGEIPSGLPTLTIPGVPLTDYFRLLPGALAIVAILMCEGLLLSRSYSRKHGYKADGDQILFAYGAMNVAAGFTGSLISGPSPSRSAAMEASGVNSQLPSLVAAATIGVTMLLFADMLAFLPNAALAGIVASAVLSLIEIDELREFWRVRRSEFWIATICLMGVLVLGPLRGVVIAFLLTTIDVIGRASKPGAWVLREAEDGTHLDAVDLDEGADATGPIVYRFGAPLYFANANVFLEDVERLVAQAAAPIKWFVLDAEAIIDIDTTGAETFREAIEILTRHGVVFAISRANRPLPDLLARYDLLELIDERRFYPTNRQALAAYREEISDSEPGSP
jgi:high affinity sulfate transporter 1